MMDAEEKTEVLKIQGALTVRVVEKLKAQIISATQSCHVLTLDLEDVEECDTAGLQLLFTATRHALQDGKTIRIGPCSAVLHTTAEKLGLKLLGIKDAE
ncbi:hypothetical protein CCP2SC5_600022 [Azospirillaceae bacterium]